MQRQHVLVYFLAYPLMVAFAVACASVAPPVGYTPTRTADDPACQQAYSLSNEYLRKTQIERYSCPFPEPE